jgi:outer membrane protein OmpA-like peptidoglycan-associated protein
MKKFHASLCLFWWELKLYQTKERISVLHVWPKELKMKIILIFILCLNLFAQTENETKLVPYTIYFGKMAENKEILNIPYSNNRLGIKINDGAMVEMITDENGEISISYDLYNPPKLKVTWLDSPECGEDVKLDNSPTDFGVVFSDGSVSYSQGIKLYLYSPKYSSSDIKFDRGESTISEDIKTQKALRGLLVFMANKKLQYPCKRFSIIGHTDTTGDLNSNQLLSTDRAIAVRDWIVSQETVNFSSGESVAFSLNDIKVIGKGESDLLVKTANNVDNKENRRVEVKIID